MGVFQPRMPLDIPVLVPLTMTAPVSPFQPYSALLAFQTMGSDLPSVVVTIGEERPLCVEHQAVVTASGLWVIFITTMLPCWLLGQLLPVPFSRCRAT